MVGDGGEIAGNQAMNPWRGSRRWCRRCIGRHLTFVTDVTAASAPAGREERGRGGGRRREIAGDRIKVAGDHVTQR